ncbi:hypothetical protein B0H14DRAFT_3662062 [Mycena olivaceomarginata]|nr:hypothetical protein B0H14DRAFT_3662062 [Mycena olivaceomarginata]
MRKGKFNTAQEAQLNTYLPEFVQKTGCRCPGIRTHTVETVNGHKGSSFPTICGSRYFYYATHRLIYLHTQRTPAFARESHDDIHRRSAQHITDTGVNEAAAYQVILKEMWDGLSTEEKSDWDSQAEDETGDIELNQKEFSTNIHLALKSLCQGGLIGDAEMILFYGFRNIKNGDLLAGSVHGHSKHNKTHFGGNDLESSYGIPWAQFVDSVLPYPGG